MSESENRTNPNYSESNQPLEEAASTPPEDVGDRPAESAEASPDTEVGAQEWETVDFPHAIRIADLLQSGEADEAPTADSPPGEMTFDPALPENVAFSPPGKLLKPSAGEEMPSVPVESRSPNSHPQTPGEREALLERLQQDNGELHHRVEQLETLLHETRQSLQQQRSQALDRQKLLDRRTAELKTAREEGEHLAHQVNSLTQQIREQTNVIEGLSADFQTSQERLARMERECALTQERYNEHSQMLLQTQNLCRDLRSRLHRQQRHTLQFKAALEKCIENPQENAKAAIAAVGEPMSAGEVSSAESSEPSAPGESSSAGIVPKAQPIAPWSAPSDSEVVSILTAPPSGKPPADLSRYRLQPPATGETLPPKTVEASAEGTVAPPSTAQTEEKSRREDGPMWEDLDPLIQRPQSPGTSDRFSAPDPSSRESWSAEVPSPLTPLSRSEKPSSTPNPPQTPASRGGTSEEELLLKAKAYAEKLEGSSSQESEAVSAAPTEPSPNTTVTTASSTEEPNWPAPVVYPLRGNGKKRRSLSAVELPSFPNQK
jgi:hypothetical protein